MGGGGGGGGHSKKIIFFKGCGEKMAITRLIAGLAPWNYIHSIENKILVTTRPKRDPVVKIPAFFSFYGLKGLNF